jgi:hypothetical protein
MLKEYLKLFGDFTKTALSVARICRYLERYWIPGNAGKSPGGIEVREIYPVPFKCVVLITFVVGLGHVETTLLRSYQR